MELLSRSHWLTKGMGHDIQTVRVGPDRAAPKNPMMVEGLLVHSIALATQPSGWDIETMRIMNSNRTEAWS